MDDTDLLSSLVMPSLSADFLSDILDTQNQNARNNSRPANNSSGNRRNQPAGRPDSQDPLSWSFNNLLDGDDFTNTPTDTVITENVEINVEVKQEAGTETTTHNTPDEYPGYGLEIPSYNPLMD
jgi:hypothetical protein